MGAAEHHKPTPAGHFDVVVIGAGFGGLHMMHKLRELGFSAQVVEAGDARGIGIAIRAPASMSKASNIRSASPKRFKMNGGGPS
mgnify:CR=1 FL=1